MKKTIMFLLTLSVIFSFSWHLPGREKKRILVPKPASGPVKTITAQDIRKKRENYRWLNKQMEKIKAKCSPALKMVNEDSLSVENDVDIQVDQDSIILRNDGSPEGNVYMAGLCRNNGTTQAVLVIIFVSFYHNAELIDTMGGWVFSNTNVQMPLEDGVTFCINSLEPGEEGFFQIWTENIPYSEVDSWSAAVTYGSGTEGPLPPAHTQLALDGAVNFTSSPVNSPVGKLHIAGNAKNPSSTYVSFATIVSIAVFDKNNTDRVAEAIAWAVGDSSSPGYDFAVSPLESKPFDIYSPFTEYEEVSGTKYKHGFLYKEKPLDIPSDGAAPFGSFDTPVNGSTVSGSIAVTGWALDDLCLASLKLYREDGGNLVYLGDTAFVAGARPDVEAAFPGYPNNSKAGWGYMLLTNFLPNGGNGTFTIHAIATDAAGKSTTLGTKTIICDNFNAVKPFGTIDTPTQGGTIFDDSYTNWGWVLTPQSCHIPTDGSTLRVYIDGPELGHPNYNIYRSDIATLFPGYANTDGAGGYFTFDTTAYAEGVHTIQWTAADSGGHSDGIGSRYFYIKKSFFDFDETGSNASALSTLSMETPIHNPREIAALPLARQDIKVKKGYGDHLPYSIPKFANNAFHIEMKELSRIEVDLSAISAGNTVIAGYQMMGYRLQRLPVGSTLDTEKCVFYWQPGPGFLKEYQLIFIEKGPTGELSRKNINIKIVPKFQ